MAKQNPNQNKKPANSGTTGTTPQPNASASRPGGTGTTQATPKTAASARPASSGERKLTPKQQAALKRQAARRRNQIIATGLIGLVVVVAVAIILIAINQPIKLDLPAATSADNGVQLNSGLTSTDERFTMGASTAAVTVTEYGDFQCPACEQFFTSNEQSLINDYVKTGKIKFQFQVWPFLDANSSYQESHIAAEAAYCAADQKRFWDFHNTLYSNQLPENKGGLTVDRMKQMASQLKLNTDQFNSCMDNHKYRSEVNSDAAKVVALGVTATPSFAINGQLVNVQGASPGTINSYNDLKDAIDKALAGKK